MLYFFKIIFILRIIIITSIVIVYYRVLFLLYYWSIFFEKRDKRYKIIKNLGYINVHIVIHHVCKYIYVNIYTYDICAFFMYTKIMYVHITNINPSKFS